MGTGYAPQIVTIERQVQPQATAGNDLNTILCTAPFDGVITAVEYITLTAITGADTNTRKTELQNMTAAGTPKPASLQYNNGVNTVAGVAKALTNSGTAADLAVTKGDTLKWLSTHLASGIADPGGLVRITFKRNQ